MPALPGHGLPHEHGGGREGLAVEQAEEQPAAVLGRCASGRPARRAATGSPRSSGGPRTARRRPACRLAPAERTVAATAEPLEGVGQVACRRSSAGRAASATRSSAGSASALPNTAWASPTRASPSTELSVSARRRAASRRTTDGDAEQLAAQGRRLVERAGPGGLLAQLGQRLGRGSAQHQDGAPFRAVLLVSSDSRSARNRSTTRLLRSSSSRDSPTIRPASEVARVPTSARSEVSACWRSASIWAWACSLTRCCLDLGLLAGLGDDRVALLAGLLADARGLLAGVRDLGLELRLGARAPSAWPPRPRRTPGGSRPAGPSSPC